MYLKYILLKLEILLENILKNKIFYGVMYWILPKFKGERNNNYQLNTRNQDHIVQYIYKKKESANNQQTNVGIQ